MNLFELFVKIGVDDQASGKLKSLSSKLGNGLKTAAKIGTAAVGAAAAGITALTTAAVNNYAEYEQLVGGVETLFKESADKVQEYAENAYKTAGLSANEYMSTVTSFSASLLQSLGGDTEAASEYANQALTDMSDNANKMGTSMEMIQNAYQGFAKANYTMLDNLKLGYGGTATEMARLVNDSGILGDNLIDLSDTKTIGLELQEVGFAKITEAIHIIQTEMGITGTTALEASQTISGSVSSMKSAWSNLVTGIADENAEFGTLVNNFVESASTVLDNILPRIEESLYGVDALIYRMFPIIMERIPQIISDFLPRLVETATMIVQSIVDGISENQEMLMETAFETITYLANSLITMLPQIVQLGLDLIVSLANGIATSLPKLIPTVIDVMMKIVNTLTQPETLSNLLDAALAVILALADGLVQFVPALIDATITLIDRLITFILDPENITKLANAAVKIVIALAEGLIKSVGTLMNSVGTLISNIVAKFKENDWGQVGKNIVDGLLNGLKNTWGNLKKWFTDAWDNLVGGVKDLLGIHSPSRVFAGIGKNMALGVGEGWEDEFGDIQGDIDKSLSFDDAIVGINASIRKVGSGEDGGAFGGTSIGNITINIDGAKYSDEQSLASAIALEIQNMTDRRAAVYA